MIITLLCKKIVIFCIRLLKNAENNVYNIDPLPANGTLFDLKSFSSTSVLVSKAMQNSITVPSSVTKFLGENFPKVILRRTKFSMLRKFVDP
jgi:hypothetical protein